MMTSVFILLSVIVGVILIALSFFGTGSYQRIVGRSNGTVMSQQSVSKAIRAVTKALNHKDILTKYIKFPQSAEERNTIKRKFYEKFHIPGVLGCIDGTHVAIIRPVEHEERYFNRKHYHSRNVQILCDNKDGGKAYRIPLNDGNSIPALGLGTFLGFDENGQKPVEQHEVEYPVTWALKAGYRMIDTAAAYQNEDQVGAGVRASGVPRENVFVVTKLPSHEARDVISSLRNSLGRLNMTYVDLYLIHSSVTFKPDHSGYDIIDYLDTWKAMEEAKKLGLAKSIGISNFNVSMIERLLANCKVKPTVLQVEVNLNLAQNELLDYCKSKNIVMMAYTPFGSLFSQESAPPAPRADNPTLVKLAEKYKKSVPQIVLRYLVQTGVVPIPKSVKKNRVEENINVFDFELTKEEMKTLSEFNKDYRVVFPSFWQDHPYYPYEKVDVPAADLFKKNE